MLIREARLRSGLSQAELGRRVNRDRAQIARWERDTVQPSFETLRELLRACGFDLSPTLVTTTADPNDDEKLQERLRLTPHERLEAMLGGR